MAVKNHLIAFCLKLNFKTKDEASLSRELFFFLNFQIKNRNYIFPLSESVFFSFSLQTKVCIKFEAAPKWFLSEGTNGFCGVKECCEWYPKETDKVVFCLPNKPVFNWFPVQAGKTCSEVTDEDLKKNIGAEISKGAVSTLYLIRILNSLSISSKNNSSNKYLENHYIL